MKRNWCLWESELPDEAIAQIVKSCEAFPTVEGEVIDETDGTNQKKVKNKEIRRSEVRWVDDPMCDGLIWRYGERANALTFGFDITRNFDVQYTSYHGSAEGHYDWHQDTDFIGETYEDRKLSLTIQLSDPKDYEGGNFEIDLNGKIFSPPEFRKKGTILVFPSFLKHRVTNVTKGTRNSLVSWIRGPHFK